MIFWQYSNSKFLRVFLRYLTFCASVIQVYQKLIVKGKYQIKVKRKSRLLNLSDDPVLDTVLTFKDVLVVAR